MNIKNYKNIHVLNHPLIKHKMTMIRDEKTNSKDFRKIVNEIAILEGYEAFCNLKTKNIKIKTPIEESIQPVIDGSKLCFVPILRAGLGMIEAFTDLIPTAKVGHIGLYRDPKTKKPIEYFIKLPKDIKNLEVVLLDPMFATGGSAIDAVNSLKKRGVKKITFICLVAAPEGVKAFVKAHKDVEIYIAALDEKLNKNKYIVPGLGDAGDRIFNTLE